MIARSGSFDSIKDTASRAIGTIEYNTSARIAETHRIKIDEAAQTISIVGKGGKPRTVDYGDRPEKFQKVIEAKASLDKALQEKSWHDIRTKAYKDLHEAERKCGEVIQGYHGFRASYIEERYNEKYEQHIHEGMTPDEADSLALTHRLDIVVISSWQVYIYYC